MNSEKGNYRSSNWIFILICLVLCSLLSNLNSVSAAEQSPSTKSKGAGSTRSNDSSRNNVNGAEEGQDGTKSNDASKSNDGEGEIPADEISQMSAQDPTLKALEYPELQVQPSASQRLSFEVQNESSRRWLYYWPIQLSSLSLLVAQSKSQGHYKDDRGESKVRLDDAISIARVTAAGWLAGTVALSALYRPYREGSKQIKFKPKDKKQLLTKERLAEEALEDAAQLTQKLNYISVLTHLGASLNLASHSSDNDKPYAIFSAVLSLTPLFFKSSTITVWDRHQTYKKRIYGPLASIHQTLVYSAGERRYFPGVGLYINF